MVAVPLLVLLLMASYEGGLHCDGVLWLYSCVSSMGTIADVHIEH